MTCHLPGAITMTDHLASQLVESILAEPKAHARKIDDYHLLSLIYRLEIAQKSEHGQGDHIRVDIGRSAQISVDQSRTTITVGQVFETSQDKIATLPAQVGAVTPVIVLDAQREIEDMRPEVVKGEHSDEGFLVRRFPDLARMGLDILEAVTVMLLNPSLGVALTVRKIAAKARKEAELAPVH